MAEELPGEKKAVDYNEPLPPQQETQTASPPFQSSDEKKWIDDDSDLDEREHKTLGVKKIEILSASYSPWARALFFFFIFLATYAYLLDSNIRTVYQTLATSSYESHSLLTTVNVVRSVIAAVAQPTFARLADVYGRMEILFVSILFFIVGTIIESQAYDVQRFAGGAILYQIGFTGCVLIMFLLASDFSLLNWRLLAMLIPSASTLINTWISGNVTDAMGGEWSWGIAMWAIIVPVVYIPLFVMYYLKYWRCKRDGHFNELDGYQTYYQRYGLLAVLKDLFWKLDVIGMFLFIAFMSLILVPLTLAGGVNTEWKTAKIIAPLVVGVCVFPAFLYWESIVEYAIIPFKLLKDRGVWAAMCIGCLINLIYNTQGDYMYTVLVVAVNESVTSATRINVLFGFVSVLTGLIFGLVVVKFRRMKPFIIFGTILWLVAMGILIKFRGGESSHSGIIGGQILLGIGAGFFTYPVQVSLQSCVSHEHMATVTAVYLAAYYMGSSVGSAIAGAIWTQLLPKKLANHLDDEKVIQSAYGDPMNFVLEYAWGTPKRESVVVAYRETQRILLITGTCLAVLLIVSSLFLRDRQLDTVQSLKHAEKNANPNNTQDDEENNVTPRPNEQQKWWKKLLQVETV